MPQKELQSELKQLIRNFPKKDQSIIEKAYFFADKQHKNQKRLSGEPYIIHPLKVAIYLASNKNDYVSVCGGLLHDLLEDTDTKYEEIIQTFGPEIAGIVEGVTKISSIKIRNKPLIFSDEDMFIDQVDNYRKILLATTSDLRVVIIKLFDRLHNVETIEYLDDSKKKFYARETIEIYAPIAERLGMGVIKGQLEDLAFPYAYPNEYEKFIRDAKKAYRNPSEINEKVIPEVEQALKRSNLKFQSISGRAKHFYSLYLKLKEKNDINQIYDILALRIIVFSVEDCYKALGIIHSIYKPLPGRIYDYISRPKDSGYQSLHTTVKDELNNIFEIQIRTEEMHSNAEYGPAAHWNYKEGNTLKNSQEWMDELSKIKDIINRKDLINTLKEELFSKRVFVFTPRGEIIDLPAGSCGIDFAYRIHTDLGNKCTGIKINNRLMPLKTELQNGDYVEAISKYSGKPKRDWLRYIKTSHARNKIRSYFRQKDEIK